jgi:hypothetical protein
MTSELRYLGYEQSVLITPSRAEYASQEIIELGHDARLQQLCDLA